MSKLEDRYRRLLRLLPAWYRAEREAEMIDTFMVDRDDELELDHGWPGWAETRAIALLAVRTRLADRDAPQRTVRFGATVRLVAVFGLLIQSVVLVALTLGKAVTEISRGDPLFGTEPYLVPLGAMLATPATFLLLITGHRLLAKGMAVVALLPTMLAFLPEDGRSEAWQAFAFHLPLWIAVLGLFAGFHRDAPTPVTRPWLRAFFFGTALAFGYTVVAFAGIPPEADLPARLMADPWSMPSWAVLIGSTVYLIRKNKSLPWTLTLAATSVALMPERVFFLETHSPSDVYVMAGRASQLVPYIVAIGQLAALVIVVTIMLGRATREYRREATPNLLSGPE